MTTGHLQIRDSFHSKYPKTLIYELDTNQKQIHANEHSCRKKPTIQLSTRVCAFVGASVRAPVCVRVCVVIAVVFFFFVARKGRPQKTQIYYAVFNINDNALYSSVCFDACILCPSSASYVRGVAVEITETLTTRSC